jgi:leader peptidase (prepilin peptidase)/N-methyltransferase
VTAFLTVFCGLLGLAIGSFLNVVIWRLPRNESVVRPASHCPSCDAEIGARDNVPVVSWLVLRGHCRHCHAPISARYPLVELATGVLFAVLAWHFGVHPLLAAYLYLAAVGVALAMIDFDHHRLPDALTLPSYVVVGVLLGVAALEAGEPWPFERALIGMAALYAFYFVVALIQPRGMGFGDVKLSGVLGLALGYLGWGQLVVGAFAAFVIGGLVGIGLILVSDAGRKTKVPFGPFMLLGTLVGVFAGHSLAHAYTSFTVG